MYLKLSLELTEKSIQYDRMLRDCNHLQGLDLDVHREKMDELAIEMQRVRQQIELLTRKK